jgi:hypothetical protein
MTIPDIGINPCDYGAVGDGIADDKAAMDAAFAVKLSTRAPMFFPGGKRFRCVLNNPWVWDFDAIRTIGGKFNGQGRRDSVVSLVPTYSGGPGIKLWQWRASSDWYYVDLNDWSIETIFDGVAITFGSDPLADPLNYLTARNFAVYNSTPGLSTEAIRLNYVVNSHLDNCQANCFADGNGANYGTALHSRQVQFTTHTNYSYGNAAYGIRFTGAWSLSNVFINGDVENVVYGVENHSPYSGGHLFEGGRFSLWEGFGARAVEGMGGPRLTFKQPSLGPLPAHPSFIDPAAATGVVVS